MYGGGFDDYYRPKTRAAIDPDDPYDLKRFTSKHRSYFDEALREIRAGRKCSCWSWFIFAVEPWVVNGVERGSWMNQSYCLRDHPPNSLRGTDAARAYLKWDARDGVDLRGNYIQIISAVVERLEGGQSSVSLVGALDDPKMRSSIKLFERVSRDGFDDEVHAVCSRAMKLLNEKPHGTPPDPAPGTTSTSTSKTGNPLSTSGGGVTRTAARLLGLSRDGSKKKKKPSATAAAAAAAGGALPSTSSSSDARKGMAESAPVVLMQGDSDDEEDEDDEDDDEDRDDADDDDDDGDVQEQPPSASGVANGGAAGHSRTAAAAAPVDDDDNSENDCAPPSLSSSSAATVVADDSSMAAAPTAPAAAAAAAAL